MVPQIISNWHIILWSFWNIFIVYTCIIYMCFLKLFFAITFCSIPYYSLRSSSDDMFYSIYRFVSVFHISFKTKCTVSFWQTKGNLKVADSSWSFLAEHSLWTTAELPPGLQIRTGHPQDVMEDLLRKGRAVLDIQILFRKVVGVEDLPPGVNSQSSFLTSLDRTLLLDRFKPPRKKH